MNPSSVALFANVYFYSKGFLFIFLWFPFAVQKLLHLIRFHLLILIFITLGGGSEKILLNSYLNIEKAINITDLIFQT